MILTHLHACGQAALDRDGKRTGTWLPFSVWGCSIFGERWEPGAEKLMVDAYVEALPDGAKAFPKQYALAAGACDIALAIGVGKVKDTGYGGLPVRDQGVLIRYGWRKVPECHPARR
jgi:hypothetical protein